MTESKIGAGSVRFGRTDSVEAHAETMRAPKTRVRARRGIKCTLSFGPRKPEREIGRSPLREQECAPFIDIRLSWTASFRRVARRWRNAWTIIPKGSLDRFPDPAVRRRSRTDPARVR